MHFDTLLLILYISKKLCKKRKKKREAESKLDLLLWWLELNADALKLLHSRMKIYFL